MYRNTDCPSANARGISLLELLIAVSIVALLAVLPVPSLVLAVRSSRESRAVATTRSIATAQMEIFATSHRFAVFEELIQRGAIANQFERGAPGGGPRGSGSEAISDGVYLYSIRYTRDAYGITIDADPSPTYAATHRRFRIRIGRRANGSGGSEGQVLYAEPSTQSPPPSAYRPLGGAIRSSLRRRDLLPAEVL